MKKQKDKIRIALAQINSSVGDLKGNAGKVLSAITRAVRAKADIISFPELVITGYPPEDLLLKPKFVSDNIDELKRVAASVKDIVAIVGFVDRKKKDLYNAAAIISGGRVQDVYHKAFLPNYGVFDEKRYFVPGKSSQVFGIAKTAFGVNICEDIWYLNGPAGLQAYKGAKLILNINASPYHVGKVGLREEILKKQARKYSVYISYTNLVGGQDELVFDGSSMVVNDRGQIIARAATFKEELLIVDVELPKTSKKARILLKETPAGKPHLESNKAAHRPTDYVEEVYEALVLGLGDYIRKNNFKKAVLGLSGGIDSSLVASLAADSIGPENVVGVCMPSVYTSRESINDAQALAGNLGIEFKIISIQDIFDKYLEFLKEAFASKGADVTEENLQARIRGNLIMALSNKFGYLALNTGNKSEVSCGYCTLYGDMVGGFGVLKDVPKTLVYKLRMYKNKREGKEVIPQSVLKKAPTAELKPNQKDSDTLPEYGLLDKVLKQYVEEDKSISEIVSSGIKEDVVLRVVKMVDSNEYKRRQAPPGIKITPKAFGKDRRMPITNRYR